MEKTVRLPTDKDGFVTQECPSCERQFKIKFGSGAPGPLAHCPYCAYQGRDCWWTTEQARFLGEQAKDLVNDLIEDSFRGSSVVKFTKSVQSLQQPPPEDE